jgi:hypothetical protein
MGAPRINASFVNHPNNFVNLGNRLEEQPANPDAFGRA